MLTGIAQFLLEGGDERPFPGVTMGFMRVAGAVWGKAGPDDILKKEITRLV